MVDKMLEDYKLIFNQDDYLYYDNLFKRIYLDKFKIANFQIFDYPIANYNFLNDKFINKIINQDDGDLKYNKIISDYIEQDFYCISKHFFKDKTQYYNNENGQFRLQINGKIENNYRGFYIVHYEYKDNKTIFYFNKNDLIQNVSPLFDNFNNKLKNITNSYISDHHQIKYLHIQENMFFKDYNKIQFWNQCYNGQNAFCLKHFNNPFDQNWYNLFCKNMVIFLNNELCIKS